MIGKVLCPLKMGRIASRSVHTAVARRAVFNRGTEVHVAIIWVAFSILLTVVAMPYQAAFANVPLTPRTVDFGAPPKNGIDARDTFRQRADASIQFVACGQELDFAARVEGGENDEDITATLLGKLAYLHRFPEKECSSDYHLYLRQEKNESAAEFHRRAMEHPVTTGAVLERVRALWGADCRGLEFRHSVDKTGGGAVWHFAWHFGVSAKCLRGQLNIGLKRLYAEKMGTEGVPCPQEQSAQEYAEKAASGLWEGLWGGVTSLFTDKKPDLDLGKLLPFEVTHDGDYDAALKYLIRILYLDGIRGKPLGVRGGPRMLEPEVAQYLREFLISTDGFPAAESYGLDDCGNTEHSVGSASERSSEGNNNDTLGELLDELPDLASESIAKALDWLGKFLLFLTVILILAFIVGAIASAAASALGSGAGVAAAIGGAASVAVLAGGIIVTASAVDAMINGIRIPETENHLLMINTTKYLQNQMLISELGEDNPQSRKYQSAQTVLKQWFLGRFQGFLKNDFVEYNAKAYQRFSLPAILNLYDFAVDPEIRDGAGLVLEYTFAKAAVGSNASRRIVPFRRKTEDFPYYYDDDEEHGFSFLDLAGRGDYQIAALMLYAGQTQANPSKNVPGFEGDEKIATFVSQAVPSEIIAATTSFYRPYPGILEIAINKVNHFQRFRHSGVEIYSSTPAFLITAGGISTDYAYRVDIPIPGIGSTGHPNDIGAAMPTTLIPTATLNSPNKSYLSDFIRIDGMPVRIADDKAMRDHNACVWAGVACGLNIWVPKEVEDCLEKRNGIDFFDSSKECSPYRVKLDRDAQGREVETEEAQAAKFYVAIFREPCPQSSPSDVKPNDEEIGCFANMGLFEAVSAKTANMTFEAFVERTVSNNTRNGIPVIAGFARGFNCEDCFESTYRTHNGFTLKLNTAARQWNERRAGILSITPTPTGPDPTLHIQEWSLAEGSVVNSRGDGLVSITTPAAFQPVTLDFRSPTDPKCLIGNVERPGCKEP